MDDLGNRMKEYESVETSRIFSPDLPIYARIDGACFSSFTKVFVKPFDIDLFNCLKESAKHVMEETHASIAFIQSDEMSFGWNNQIYGGKVFKYTSKLSSMFTSSFWANALESNNKILENRVKTQLPSFDCRAFQVPNNIELMNEFYWRFLDAKKNAVSMAAHCLYSHKSLQHKNTQEKIALINEKKAWNSYPSEFRYGCFLKRETIERALTDLELSKIPEEHRPIGMIKRSQITEHSVNLQDMTFEEKMTFINAL